LNIHPFLLFTENKPDPSLPFVKGRKRIYRPTAMFWRILWGSIEKSFPDLTVYK